MHAESLPRVLATGFDTVHYTAPVEPPAKLYKQLAALKEEAQKNRPAIMELGDDALVMQPSGGGRWRYRLEGAACNVLVSDNPNQGVKFKVELGSLPLWSQGTEAAYQRSRGIVSQLAGAASWPALASRVDLAVDMQGWEPAPEMSLAIVARGRKRDHHADGKPGCPSCRQPVERDWKACPYCCAALEGAELALGPHRRFIPNGALPCRTYYGRLLFRGFDWGSGKPIRARLYCKSLEIRENSPDKAWFGEVWERAAQDGYGYDPSLPVWRLEVQARRQLLQKLARKDGRDFGSLFDCIHDSATLWRYLVGGADRVCSGDESHKVKERFRRCRVCDAKVKRPTGWVELRASNPAIRQPTRWPLHPAWRALQTTHFECSAPAVPAARKKRNEAEEGVIAQMFAGILSTGAALRSQHVRELRARCEREGRDPTNEEYFAAGVEAMRESLANRGLLDGDDKRPSLGDRIVTKLAARPQPSRACGCGARVPLDESYCHACGVVMET